ncbi:MAG: type II toxin-antitoxin system HicB family antitoxin [Patescibacteria group bacterium]
MKIKTQNKIFSFRTIIEPEENGGYHGFVPLLHGLHTQGETIKETESNLREAIKCHINGLLLDNEEIPQEQAKIEVIESFSSNDFAFA